MTRNDQASQQQTLRFAIYCRYSADVQSDISLESQEMMCRTTIAKRGGTVVAVYKDAARVGWSLDREDFNRLRSDAEKGQFDAIMMWKFDRLARDQMQAAIIKALLRHEYKIRLYCVEGFSEDDDGSFHPAMMEQMLAVFSAFYSQNLGNEISRANRYRHATGKFNGSKPPFGYILATERVSKRPNCVQASAEMPPGLYVDPRAAALVRRAFKLYATGMHSYMTIAQYLTEKADRLHRPLEKPFNPQMVRDLLQNKIYCGYVSYSETTYRGGIRQQKVAPRLRREWNVGNHQPIISEELFEQCQAVRIQHAGQRKNRGLVEWQLLSGLVYCAQCLSRKPVNVKDENYGKMYTHTPHGDKQYYKCSASNRGYEVCGQRQIRLEKVDQQVIETLHYLHERLAPNHIYQLESILRQHIENEAAVQRMNEIQLMIERIDFSWENGFMDAATYAQKQQQLQLEIEMLPPNEYSELLKSTNLLQDFDKVWSKCQTRKAQRQLIKQLVERVIVKDQGVFEIILKGEISVSV